MTISYARRAVGPVRCWLCGTNEGPLRSDVHLTGHLCSPCWSARPRGATSWGRAASALAIRLQLGRHWTESGFRQGWLQEIARRHRITAWHDAPSTATAPDAPFGWLPADAFDQAAAELERREAEFNRSRITRT
ncbi:hypothetical protein ACQSMD_33400 [Streptomyces flavovirens]|uniref:hypothetical protein n=1 Tax=Streptomyces TaxID=1883 RepID=UPI002FCAFBE6